MSGYSFFGDSSTKLFGSLVLDGNAQDANVLSGFTYFNTSGSKRTGTIVTRTPSSSSVLFDSGYYASDFNLSVVDSNLIAGNILNTATIFGITGTAETGGGDPGFGFIEFNTPSYSDNGNGTVTDSANGLVWQQSSYGPGQPRNWQQAMDYCDNNTPALPGTGWRVPNMAEVGLLYDYLGLEMYGSPFTNNMSFWSSTTVPSSPSNAYYLNSADPHPIRTSFKVNPIPFIGVRCVRSGN